MNHFFSLRLAARRSFSRLWGRALSALLLATASASAQTIYGLGTYTGFNVPSNFAVGTQVLIRIDAGSGASLTPAPIRIMNVASGQVLVGIDFRPADNQLYALGYAPAVAAPAANAQLYTLDLGTNQATAVGSAQRLELGATDEGIGFDFNPVADLIRVVSAGTDANYRLSPLTGAIVGTDTNLAYAGGVPGNPGVGTVAYTNSYQGSVSTTLYDIDYLNNGLLSIQNPPNAGTLTTQSTVQFVIPSGMSAGTYGIGSPRHLGLDIYFNTDSVRNIGYLTEVTALTNVGFGRTSRSSNLYRVNLATGRAVRLGNTIAAGITTNLEIRDIAAVNAIFPPLTWNGSVSTNWRTAANWTPAQVPTALNDVTIPGTAPNQPTVSQSQQVRALTLAGGAVLSIPSGGTLFVGGNFTNNGSALSSSGTGTVVLESTTTQLIGGTSATAFQNLVIGNGSAGSAVTLTAPASVHGLLTLVSSLTVTGQPFTLLSDAAGTAQVINVAGTVVGPVAVQRYITPTNAGLGYRHYSSPVSNSTVADLTTAGFTPIVDPSFPNQAAGAAFPNVFGYNQNRLTSSTGVPDTDFSKGYFSPASTSDPLTVTQGYTVNIGAASTVDFVGTLNNGPYVAGNLERGNQPFSGWHLRGNPYPSPLDWQLIIDNGGLTDIDPALFVFKSSGQYTGTYASYINGVSANGSDVNLLPLGQSFFVRTRAGASSGSITFTNNERPQAYVNPAFERGSDPRPQLALSLHTATARTQTVVYFEAGATSAVDTQFDATYLNGSNGLTLATEAGTEPLSINGLPVLTGQDVRLPLRLSATATGPATLAVDMLRNLPAGYHAYLLNATTGTFTDLATTAGVALSLSAGAPAGGRYALLFTTQSRVLATAPQELAQLASVYPNPAHGTATLLLPAALRGPQATTVQVLDNLGRVVLTRLLAAGAATLELPVGELMPGSYLVQARTAAGLVARRLVVQ